MNSKVVFIAGLDLSGSTIVDMALGSLPGIAGLGEVDNILDPLKRAEGESLNGPIAEETCTCGERGTGCAVWGPVLDFIEKNPESSYADRYSYLAERATAVTGASILVDSSKQINALKRHVAFKGELYPDASNFSAILIYRSPISWLLSDWRRAKRRNQKRNFRISQRRLQKWLKRYVNLVNFLQGSQVPTAILTLKRFQEEPLSIVECLRCLSISVENRQPLNIGSTNSHVLWGSHHRLDKSRSSAVTKQAPSSLLSTLAALTVALSLPESLVFHARFSRRTGINLES